uniref:Uncharacterized protein n=1 Tax=Zea mays TaxID=4577 RepID=B6SGN8_MAIZE|nr:hypothetical protein [Zea mays]
MAPVEAEQHRRRALALAAHDASGAVSPIRISRRYAYAFAHAACGWCWQLAVARRRCPLDLFLAAA